jgi:hypothetical protein
MQQYVNYLGPGDVISMVNNSISGLEPTWDSGKYSPVL